MADVIRTFTHPANAAFMEDFATVRRTMYAAERDAAAAQKNDARNGGQTAEPDKTAAEAAQDVQNIVFVAMDKTKMRFAPQLRFGRDVSVSLETILSWLGTQEEMIPTQLFTNLCGPLERLMATVEGCATVGDAIRTSAAGVANDHGAGGNEAERGVEAEIASTM